MSKVERVSHCASLSKSSMASFLEDLWSSIFTPGPTPSLLVATNATFASLQFLLFVLLIVTHSVHFVVLSFLSGALWWSINWFSNEVKEVRIREEEKEKQKARLVVKGKQKTADAVRMPAVIDSTESETETESLAGDKDPIASSAITSSAERPPIPANPAPQLSAKDEVLRKRRSLVESSGSSGYMSTDSEWEKVDGGKNS